MGKERLIKMEEMIKLFESMEINIYNNDGSIRNLVDILDDLAKHWIELNDNQKQNMIFGLMNFAANQTVKSSEAIGEALIKVGTEANKALISS
jgi:hypothetical protein